MYRKEDAVCIRWNINHKMEGNLAICKNMGGAEDILFSETSDKDQHCVSSLICGIFKQKSTETEGILVVTRGRW